MRARRRRFYKDVEVQNGGLALDGRPVRTPARHALTAPTAALAEAIAAEWRNQQEFVDPAMMPLTRLANTIIDGLGGASRSPGEAGESLADSRPDRASAGTAATQRIDAVAAVADEIVRYFGSDLVCYRAATPAGLVAQQAEHWDPLVAWAESGLGAALRVGAGITHKPQQPEAIAAARAHLPHDPWRLGAVHSITTLTGSAVIALAVAAGAIDRDAAWAAAHVDEDWNMALWGRDTIALERRAFRFAEMKAAAQVLDALRNEVM